MTETTSHSSQVAKEILQAAKKFLKVDKLSEEVETKQAAGESFRPTGSCGKDTFQPVELPTMHLATGSQLL